MLVKKLCSEQCWVACYHINEQPKRFMAILIKQVVFRTFDTLNHII